MSQRFENDPANSKSHLKSANQGYIAMCMIASLAGKSSDFPFQKFQTSSQEQSRDADWNLGSLVSHAKNEVASIDPKEICADEHINEKQNGVPFPVASVEENKTFSKQDDEEKMELDDRVVENRMRTETTEEEKNSAFQEVCMETETPSAALSKKEQLTCRPLLSDQFSKNFRSTYEFHKNEEEYYNKEHHKSEKSQKVSQNFNDTTGNLFAFLHLNLLNANNFYDRIIAKN